MGRYHGEGTEGNGPCENNGSAVSSCSNSVSANCALLTVSGDHSTSADTTEFQVSGGPSAISNLFFQGTASTTVGNFGDGPRRVSESILRFSVKTLNSGIAPYPTVGDLLVSVRGLVPGLGGRRFYQV